MNSLIEQIYKIDTRLSWDEYFSLISLLVSKRSSCDRLHVGCVLVKENRIISTGYNGHVKNTKHTSVVIDNSEQMTIHAETNAILDAASRGVSVKNCDVYVTHFPCLNCMKSLLSIEVKNVYYINDYKNNSLCYDLCNQTNTKIVQLK
jgi:dCMP deaminase